MAQNSMRAQWSHQEVDDKLQAIMRDIHAKCAEHGRDGNSKNGDSQDIDYVRGANIAGFLRVADAMLSQGVV